MLFWFPNVPFYDTLDNLTVGLSPTGVYLGGFFYFPENLIETLEPAVFKIGASGSTVYGLKDPGCRDH